VAVEMTANNVLSLSQSQLQQYPPAYGGFRSPRVGANDIWPDDYRSPYGFKVHTIPAPFSLSASRSSSRHHGSVASVSNSKPNSPSSSQSPNKHRSKSVDHKLPGHRLASKDSISDYLAGELFAGDKREGEAARVSCHLQSHNSLSCVAPVASFPHFLGAVLLLGQQALLLILHEHLLMID